MEIKKRPQKCVHNTILQAEVIIEGRGTDKSVPYEQIREFQFHSKEHSLGRPESSQAVFS